MAYKVLGRTEELLCGYSPLPGLEGPFVFSGGRVLYYDKVQGQYWDPRTDFYIDHEEMSYLRNQIFDVIRG